MSEENPFPTIKSTEELSAERESREKLITTMEEMRASLEESSPMVKAMKIYNDSDTFIYMNRLLNQQGDAGSDLPNPLKLMLDHPDVVLYNSLESQIAQVKQGFPTL